MSTFDRFTLGETDELARLERLFERRLWRLYCSCGLDQAVLEVRATTAEEARAAVLTRRPGCTIQRVIERPRPEGRTV
jgi:hypothetical protein